MFGEKGGLLSLFLFVFCPNLNGHGILLTTDAYTALFTVSTTYFYWKFIKRSGWKYFLAFSISLGLAQIVKYSMIHLYVFLAIVSIFVLIKRRTIFSGCGRNLIRLVVLKMMLLFFINVGFLFNKPGKSLDEYKMSSQAFTKLQNSFIVSIPLPVPEPYIVGLDQTSYMNELGAGDPNVSDVTYLLGEKRAGTGFWYYYVVVFIFKTPLTALLILMSSVVYLFVRKEKQGHPSTMLFLLGLIFYFFLVLGLQNNVQIGIRHALMIYPLVYVLCGFFVTISFFQKKTKLLQGLLVVYTFATYYYFFPNLLSYSNELIPVKRNAYKVMADSNLDFGQGVYALEKYLESHPDVYVADSTAGVGKFAIRVGDYLNLKNDNKFPGIYNLKPVGHINHCFLLFNNGN